MNVIDTCFLYYFLPIQSSKPATPPPPSSLNQNITKIKKNKTKEEKNRTRIMSHEDHRAKLLFSAFHVIIYDECN